MEEQIPEILYHYCSVDTFVKIVQNRTLRLSEIAKSNDSMECQWVEKEVVPPILRRELSRAFETFGVKLDSKKETQLLEETSRFFCWPFGNEIDNQAKKFVFALCLSEEPDLLSQWRGYATDGYGVSVGFDTDLFRKFYNPSFSSLLNFQKVIYDRETQEKEIEPETKAYIQRIFQEVKTRQGVAEKDVEWPLFFELFPMSFSMLFKSMYLKNGSFSEEKEWRLFASFFNINSISELEKQMKSMGLMSLFSDLGTMVKSDKLLFYFDLMLDKDLHENAKPDSLKKVYLGPKCKLIERDVRLLLENYGWDISSLEVIKSKATYM